MPVISARNSARTIAMWVSCGLVAGGCGGDELQRVPTDPVYPNIYAQPNDHDFGEIEVGTPPVTHGFAVGNNGQDTLDVQTVIITGADAAAFTLGDDQVSGASIAVGGAELVLSVAFSPERRGTHKATLEISSNDPDDNPLILTLYGRATEVPTGDGPVAVCAVDPRQVTPLTDSATWIGNLSHDPDGYPIVGYTWRLQSRPAGSAAVMPACNNAANCAGFVADLAGAYVGELTVQNSIGLTDTCTASLQAVPEDDLWVEMYWTHSGDDMDLHLLAPGGIPRTFSDCYYGNCVALLGFSLLDWGQSGNQADNPALDLDDIPGTGPENINIQTPAPGVYTVFVHDFPGSVNNIANDVTVTVYLSGSPVYTDTRTISVEDHDEYFCTIDWPAGTVTPL